MLNLEITEAARDSILSIDWTDAAENRNLDGKRFVIALLWANPITRSQVNWYLDRSRGLKFPKIDSSNAGDIWSISCSFCRTSYGRSMAILSWT